MQSPSPTDDASRPAALAAEKLLPLVYQELRQLAAARLAAEKPGQTLQATALVHEAYLRLVGPSASGGRQPPDSTANRQSSHQGADAPRSPTDAPRSPAFNSRGHFFAAAAEAMRRILIEQARRKGRIKHGGGQQRVDLDSECLVADDCSLDLLALDEALSKLAAMDAAKAELVKLRYFAGLTMPEAAAALDVSLATAERWWTFSKSWLYAELSDRPREPEP
ncbi:MAG TPA: ECF-type sigma factor [Pirellulaceae bacterium]|nr:ECF-type sigma factor [Pirellulaceae bacterium]